MNRKFWITAFFTMGCSTHALAHARLKPVGKLTPRNQESGLKNGPCGGVAIDETKRVTISAGDTLTVEWEETINHPGSFKISFAPNGTSEFTLLKEVPDTNDGPVTYSDPSTYHQYSTTVTVPDVSCNTCVIQLIQVMTDRDPPTFYYSCADVKITGGSITADDDTMPSTSSKTSTKTNTATSTTTDASDDDDAQTDKPEAPKNLKAIVKGKSSKLHLSTPHPSTSQESAPASPEADHQYEESRP